MQSRQTCRRAAQARPATQRWADTRGPTPRHRDYRDTGRNRHPRRCEGCIVRASTTLSLFLCCSPAVSNAVQRERSAEQRCSREDARERHRPATSRRLRRRASASADWALTRHEKQVYSDHDVWYKLIVNLTHGRSSYRIDAYSERQAAGSCLTAGIIETKAKKSSTTHDGDHL